MGQFSWKSILIILFSVGFFIWLTQAMILSSCLSSRLRIPISIDWVSITPHQTIMYNFKIRNPRGFQSRFALWAKTTEIDYQVSQFVKNPSLIDQILLDTIYVVIDAVDPGATQNNWTVISDRMSKFIHGHGVDIKKIVLTNLIVEIHEGKSKKVSTRKVDRVEIDNMGSQKGFPTERIVQEIFVKSGLEMFIENAFDPGQVLGEAFNPIGL